jgi:hypothetical protein
MTSREAGEIGVVLGRAAAQAWQAGELPAEPEAVRQLLTGTSALAWVAAAGFLIGMEQAGHELTAAVS